ncbi:Gag-Pol polyprotein [Frankliniella fusca]|uniref:Gag-Pol polyprotein n=1 Tax=Frankliniella fusca TaxID=407009 RepID=A0AAE1H0Q9_9NEOP|nr:Gag-Pol polyprotein [Frankliniella fusca]
MEGIPPCGGRAGGRRGGRGAVRRGPIVDRPAWRAPLLFPPGVDNEAVEADLYEAGSDVEMEVLDQPEQAAQAGPADINALLQELAALRAAMQAGGAGQHAAFGAAVPQAGPAQQPPAAAPERFGYAPYFQNPPPFPRVVSASEMLTLRKAVPRFDGKMSHEAYRASFDDLVGLYPPLTEDQRFQLLSSGLQGAPQSLLEDLGENRTFAALDKALRLSYSKPVHAWTVRCQQVKGPAEKTRAPMKVFREGTLFGRFHVDFLGPLQPSYPERYQHVMVVVEVFSAWPKAVPLRTLQAAEVANALVSQVFSRLGAPYELVTDQRSTFESALFKEVMAIYKTRKCHVSVGRPAGNGKVENYIRCLTRQIAVLATEQPSNWPDLLPHVLHAYRASVNDTTGFSPYEVLYGRSMRVPQDLQHSVPPPGLPDVAMSQYPGVLRDRLSKIHHLVRENTHRATLRNKSHYDKFSTLTYFKPGDIVLLYNRRRRRGKTTKLYAAWEGPFKILDMLNDCIARIEEVRPENYVGRRQRKRLIVHVDRLAAIGSNLVDQNGEWIEFH